jgi:hypothetical protein
LSIYLETFDPSDVSHKRRLRRFVGHRIKAKSLRSLFFKFSLLAFLSTDSVGSFSLQPYAGRTHSPSLTLQSSHFSSTNPIAIMKFTNAAISIAFLSASSLSAAPLKRAVDPALVPEFGVEAGQNPTGTGDCDGINGIKIPCACPPDRDAFIESLNRNVDAGKAVNNPSVAVSFPTGNSKADKIARIQASIVTLQNLNGVGVGCPAASTTFVAQQKAIESGTDDAGSGTDDAGSGTDGAESGTDGAADPPADAGQAGGDIAKLAPDLGATAGKNPTGTGDCDGAVNGPDGNPIKVPCACPPAQDVYIAALTENVKAGKAVNNPTVKVDFPTGDSNADKSARITAALITLQNLNGVGKGCPASSTTLVAQQKALA